MDGLTEHEKQLLALPLRLLCHWVGLNMCHPSPRFPDFPITVLPRSVLGRR